jgi:hypothetical protein
MRQPETPLCTVYERGRHPPPRYFSRAGISVGRQPLIVSVCAVTIRSLTQDHSTGDVAIAEESREVCGCEALDCHCGTQDERQP